jgi:hypothetical protein
MSKGRIERGAQAQENFSQILETLNVPVSFVAPKHSNKPDIIFDLDNVVTQAEVKNTKDFNTITIFDKTVTRGKPNPDVDNIIKKFKGFSSFEKYIDHIRKEHGDKYAGFVGDTGIEGVSGKMPIESFRFEGDRESLAFVSMIRSHWSSNGDDFFVLMQTGGSKFSVFSTDAKTKYLKQLKALPFSGKHIKEIHLATAGEGGGDGKLRVALKVSLNIGLVKVFLTSKYIKQ